MEPLSVHSSVVLINSVVIGNTLAVYVDDLVAHKALCLHVSAPQRLSENSIQPSFCWLCLPGPVRLVVG